MLRLKSRTVGGVSHHPAFMGNCPKLHRGVAVITTAQLHSTKSGLNLCTGSNPAPVVVEISDDEHLWQWSRLEIRLNAFRRSTIPQKNLITIIIIIIIPTISNRFFSPIYPVEEFSLKEMRTWGRSKILSYCFFVSCESGL